MELFNPRKEVNIVPDADDEFMQFSNLHANVYYYGMFSSNSTDSSGGISLISDVN